MLTAKLETYEKRDQEKREKEEKENQQVKNGVAPFSVNFGGVLKPSFNQHQSQSYASALSQDGVQARPDGANGMTMSGILKSRHHHNLTEPQPGVPMTAGTGTVLFSSYPKES